MRITVKKRYGRLASRILWDMTQDLQPCRRNWPARV
jgi:hypothetical protein